MVSGNLSTPEPGDEPDDDSGAGAGAGVDGAGSFFLPEPLLNGFLRTSLAQLVWLDVSGSLSTPEPGEPPDGAGVGVDGAGVGAGVDGSDTGIGLVIFSGRTPPVFVCFR